MPVRSAGRTDQLSGSRQRSAGSSPRTLVALRVTSVLTLACLAFQFVTAGVLISRPGASADIHGGGAIVLHVLAGLTAVAAVVHWRKRHTGRWPSVIAALVFLFSFVQAAIGDSGVMWLHVPGALVLTVGAVWLTAWSFGRGTNAQDSDQARTDGRSL